MKKTLLLQFLSRRLTFATFISLASLSGTSFAKDTISEEASSEEGPRLNPFECYGRYESASGNRSVSQMEIELEKKLAQRNQEDPKSVAAMKACVIARFKARLGHSDASEWFEQAIAGAPYEPGYELFFGMYYGEQRGARGPVLEEAERHYYRALEKLDALAAEGKVTPPHEEVRKWVQKKLLVLYQQDGQALVPFKASPAKSGQLQYPGLSVFGQFLIGSDTRDYFYNNEMRTFAGEVSFAESPVRANRPLTNRELYDVVRAPLRRRTEVGVRLRQNIIGAIDLALSEQHDEKTQIISFYQPTLEFADVNVKELRAGYQRMVPLYPLLDARIAGNYRYTKRTGAVEFEPLREESFHGFDVKPALSRFFGTDKLTLDGVYAYFDLADLPGGVPDQALREKLIRGIRLSYSIYSPLTLVSYELGSFERYRTATRGLTFFAGVVEDDETYGSRRVTKHDIYGGIRYGGPTAWDVSLQGAYVSSFTSRLDLNAATPALYLDPSLSFQGVRSSLLIERRIVDPEAKPALDEAPLSLDMMNLVLPMHWDKALSGVSSFENVRGGLEAWLKLFGARTWGTPLLLTAGYDLQYFYNVQRIDHLWRVGIRLGWGDL